MMSPIEIIEIIAIVFGIISVWFSKKENIWVFPSGLINTSFYVYLSLKGDLYGEAAVNLYYTIMSLYGWYNWLRRNDQNERVIRITYSSRSEWITEILFFTSLYILIFLCLAYIKNAFAPGAIPWADALASASAFTGMWLMARKKVNSWIWWIITNIASIPLYLVKGYEKTSIYYLILLVLAIMGLQEWRNKADEYKKA
jgi:nicotinamide mononucleotide transporter